jgi:hypothetical protein
MGIDRPIPTDPTYFAKIDKLVIIEKEGEADSLKPYQWSRVGWDLTHWQDPYKSGLLMTDKNNLGWYGIKTDAEGNVMVGITCSYHGKRSKTAWIDFQLACSRDGYRWQHVADQAIFFPRGEPGSWDQGMVLYAQVVEVPTSDKLYIYYLGSRTGHGRADVDDEEDPKFSGFPRYNMGVAFLRKDGYVSLEAEDSTSVGVVETKPIRFLGHHLFVNAEASKGSIEVELCDAAGRPLPGLSRKKAKPLTADSLRHRVQWGQVADVSAWAGKAVTLRFYLHKGAKLYSYCFGDPDPHFPSTG